MQTSLRLQGWEVASGSGCRGSKTSSKFEVTNLEKRRRTSARGEVGPTEFHNHTYGIWSLVRVRLCSELRQLCDHGNLTFASITFSGPHTGWLLFFH